MNSCAAKHCGKVEATKFFDGPFWSSGLNTVESGRGQDQAVQFILSYSIFVFLVHGYLALMHCSKFSYYISRESSPLPSNRHHRSSGDCLEGKRENYQVCSVQYCVQQLYTVNCTHI